MHLFGIEVTERLTNIFKHQFRWFFAVHTSHQALLFVMVNDWHGLAMENGEPFFQRVNVVIGSTSATVQATIDAHTVRTFKE